eukprot:1151314-Pelagomonas_calceolata.AAC.1
MYACDVCQRTYHWEELGCYTDEQRQEVHMYTAETWACPACACLSNEDKFNRETKPMEELLKVIWISSWKPEDKLNRKTKPMEELLKVNWILSWKPEETKTIWPTFHQRMQEFEAQQSKPNFLLLTADLAFSNPERQGFDKLDTSNTWKQKLDTELCNEITFDVRPTDPQTYIKPTCSHTS